MSDDEKEAYNQMVRKWNRMTQLERLLFIRGLPITPVVVWIEAMNEQYGDDYE
jgi:hypothetical protein